MCDYSSSICPLTCVSISRDIFLVLLMSPTSTSVLFHRKRVYVEEGVLWLRSCLQVNSTQHLIPSQFYNKYRISQTYTAPKYVPAQFHVTSPYNPRMYDVTRKLLVSQFFLLYPLLYSVRKCPIYTSATIHNDEG